MNEFKLPDKEQSREQRVKNYKLEQAQRKNSYITTTSYGKLLIGRLSEIRDTPADLDTNLAYKWEEPQEKKTKDKSKFNKIVLSLFKILF